MDSVMESEIRAGMESINASSTLRKRLTLALAHAGLLVSTSSAFILSLEAIQQAAQRLSLRPPILDEGYCL